MFFNAAAEEKVELGFRVFENGEYPAVIENAEMRTSQAGAEYLSLRVKCFKSLEDGSSVNVFMNLNINNHNETARSMARTLLANVCEATGKLQLQTPADLIGGKFVAKLVKSKDSKGEFRNECKNARALQVDFNPEFLAAKKAQAATSAMGGIPTQAPAAAQSFTASTDSIPF